jgi:hypothetical protein
MRSAMGNMVFTANYIDIDIMPKTLFSQIEIALLLIAGLIIIFLLTNHYASSKRQRPFPPGPFILNQKFTSTASVISLESLPGVA